MKLEDYGVIGDLHTAALVGLNGSMDWLCMPRFDSDACFASLLGEEENGCWRIAPTAADQRARHRYRPDTLILETEFVTPGGQARLIDCMPPGGSSRQVVRVVEGMAGSVEMKMVLLVRFDYGRTIPWVRHATGGGIYAVAGPNGLVLHTGVQTHGEGLSTVAHFTVQAGERLTFVLTWYPSHEEPPVAVDGLKLIDQTERYWREWTARCTYHGEWREAVMRSLIMLKALTYAPTGGIVAAATTSLPEQLGGVRNWDYRFCWLRDATFTLFSLMEAGYTDEARAWTQWLLRAVAGHPAQLQIMYGVAGERGLPELELRHLKGYENSRPVRVGNAAAEQFQLDVYGEVVDALYLARKTGLELGSDAWNLERNLIEFVAKNWMHPDEGIWEIRGPRRHFTHSKVMAWVALDRAVKTVEEFRLPGDADRWRGVRDAIHTDVCAHGFNARRGAFTQYYGGEPLDASVLMLPLVGFLPAADPRVVATIDAIQRELVVDGLVRRYLTDAASSVDGLPPGEGAFLPCSFWLVDCLHLLGRRNEARALFQRLLDCRNSLGLLAEEYDCHHGRQVGNLPQAFSHVGLINTARNLEDPIAGPADLRSAGHDLAGSAAHGSG
jgi:GH15 family glucan-1,4-alpha-glucosidase